MCTKVELDLKIGKPKKIKKILKAPNGILNQKMPATKTKW